VDKEIVLVGYSEQSVSSRRALKDVYLAAPARKRVTAYKYRAPDSGRRPVASALVAWFAELKTQELCLVGFDLKEFVETLAYEASLPSCTAPLPLWLWLRPPLADIDFMEHLLIAAASTPQQSLVDERRIVFKEGGWISHMDAEEDLRITAELAAQYGLMPRPKVVVEAQ
jgi:hypothetical protein